MKIEIDESRCISAGNCVLISPELFDQRDEDGVVILLDDSPDDEQLRAAAKEAAAACPARVIVVHS